MRVVVDTNVLISATFWSGDSEKIIIKAENKEFELITSKELIQELSDVLNSDEIKDIFPFSQPLIKANVSNSAFVTTEIT